MLVRHVRSLLLLPLMLAVTSAPAMGQTRVEFIPHLGSYLPISDFGSVRNTSTSSSSFKQSIGVLAGGRLRLEFPSRFGVEVGVSYVEGGWTETAVFSSGRSIGQSLPGSTLVGELRATYRPRRSNAYLLVGTSYWSRSGDAWDASFWDQTTGRPPAFLPTIYNKANFAGIVGLGLRAQASPSFALDVTLEAHLSSGKRVAQGFSLAASNNFQNNEFQTDLILKVGYPIALTR